MRQFQIEYLSDKLLLEELEKISKWCDANPSYTIIFRIYSEDIELEHIKHVCDILDDKMPDALYLGCTSTANILNGVLTEAKIILTCTIFECETTQVKLMQLSLAEEDVKEDVRKLREYCDSNTWVSAVEIHATMLGMSVKDFCDEMSTLRSDIQVFGGGACNPNMDIASNIVFSKGNGFSKRGIIFLLFGGSDLHTYSTFICGWQSLKRKFKVTKARGDVLYELDGAPAFNIYQRFLNINNNNHFVFNSVEFPLSVDFNGIDILRCPVMVNDDNSLVMTAEVPDGSDVRLAFGDPETILGSILCDGQNIANFQPEIIQTFSCAARKAFWGDKDISNETIQFNNIAPTSGFYTSGEFLRVNGIVYDFNSTLVFAAMREGEPKSKKIVKMYDANLDSMENERITLIRRFISFIEASTAEFEELNRKLAVMSVTDGLTGLYNRREMTRRIRHIIDERNESEKSDNLSFIMLDIDDFKKVNDTYGHKEGDRVIIALANVLKKQISSMPSCSLGRWGGEEFIILLPNIDINEASDIAENIRAEFESVTLGQTVSIGVIHARNDESADSLYIRVDEALYMAKANGKNQVVTIK